MRKIAYLVVTLANFAACIFFVCASLAPLAAVSGVSSGVLFSVFIDEIV